MKYILCSLRFPEARAIKRKIIYHAGPTNSGKTHAAIERYHAAHTGVYCGPLRLLATEVFRKTNNAVSKVTTTAVHGFCHFHDVAANFPVCIRFFARLVLRSMCYIVYQDNGPNGSFSLF